jgi:hypothetical protein
MLLSARQGAGVVRWIRGLHTRNVTSTSNEGLGNRLSFGCIGLLACPVGGLCLPRGTAVSCSSCWMPGLLVSSADRKPTKEVADQTFVIAEVAAPAATFG